MIPSLPDKNKKFIEFDSLSPIAPWRVVNIGSGRPIKLEQFLNLLEKNIKRKIKKNYLGMQLGDVPKTYADISLLKELTGFTPKVSIEDGINEFLKWYYQHYIEIS